MNWNQIEGAWKQMSGKLRETWGDLTDSEIEQAAGKRENLVGLIQRKYGVAQEEAEKKVDEWAEGASKALSSS